MLAVAAVAASVVALLVLGRPDPSPAASADPRGGVRTGCAQQSSATLPRAYGDRRNRVVGPLALVGGATFTDAATARRFGGNKFPLLVRAGHTVTVSVVASARRTASLAYGPLAQGDAGGHHTVTFVACSAGESRSTAGGPVTFWSGFVMVSEPGCVPLDVYIDDRPLPRRVKIELGRRCAKPPPPLRGCAEHVEGGKPSTLAPFPAQVAIGPLRFAGLARVASSRAFAINRTGRLYGVKSGVGVPAGVRATLSVARSARSWAALDYTPSEPGKPRREPGAAVRFEACAADHPAFSYDGPVGPITGFSGGFVLKRPGCVPLEVRVAGRPTVRARVPFGVGRCRS